MIFFYFVTGFGNSTTDCVFFLNFRSQPVVTVPIRCYNTDYDFLLRVIHI